MIRQRFKFIGPLREPGPDSPGMFVVSGPVDGRQIRVMGACQGAESLATTIAAVLARTEKVYQGQRRDRTQVECQTVWAQVQYQGVIITAYDLPNVDQAGSPSGFEWGYGGSGPAALAMSLLEDHLADHVKAERLHQSFKSEIVEHWQGDNWRITSGQIEDWIFRHEERMAMAQLDAAAIRQEVGRP